MLGSGNGEGGVRGVAGPWAQRHLVVLLLLLRARCSASFHQVGAVILDKGCNFGIGKRTGDIDTRT